MHASARRSIVVARVIAWAGSALFVASLIYFLFSYTVTFGAPTNDAAIAWPVTWNVTLFTIFAIHHSVFARERIRRAVMNLCGQRLERSFYVWVASLLFIAVCALWQPVAGVAWAADGIAIWILRLLQLLGVWLALRSAAILDVFDLSGVRQAEQRPERPLEFTPRGPYGWVRHPIYTGWFLIVFAAPAMTMTRLVFAVVSCTYLLAAIPFEERSLRTASSGAYDRYMAEVRWKLVPGLY